MRGGPVVYWPHTFGEQLEKVRPFVRVPLDVVFGELRSPELTFAVQFLALWWKRGEPIGLDYSVRELALEFGINAATVVRILKRLIEKGMIERMKGKGNRSLYSPTAKLTGKSASIYIMSSCGFDPAAVTAYAKHKKVDFDPWLPYFWQAAKRHGVTTEESYSVVDAIAKSSRPITKRGGYVNNAFLNIVSQRSSGASSRGKQSNPSPSPSRKRTAFSETDVLIALQRQLNADSPVTTDMLPRELLNLWDENGYVRYDAARDCYFKRSDEFFFYVTTNDGRIRTGKVADFETIQSNPFVVTSGVHATA